MDTFGTIPPVHIVPFVPENRKDSSGQYKKKELMLGRLHNVLCDPYLGTFGAIASLSALLSHWSSGSSFSLRRSIDSGEFFPL